MRYSPDSLRNMNPFGTMNVEKTPLDSKTFEIKESMGKRKMGKTKEDTDLGRKMGKIPGTPCNEDGSSELIHPFFRR